MTGARRGGGFTIIELMIACFLSLVVVLAMGRIIQQNVISWQQGRDKAVLQQNVTEALEWMSRWVRSSRSITVVSASELRCYDETGALTHTFRRTVVGGEGRLQQDGADLVDRVCPSFTVTPDTDTTRLTLALQLQDPAGNLVAATTRAAVRNRFFEY
jgi:type II secretory pathway component PulJ